MFAPDESASIDPPTLNDHRTSRWAPSAGPSIGLELPCDSCADWFSLDGSGLLCDLLFVYSISCDGFPVNPLVPVGGGAPIGTPLAVLTAGLSLGPWERRTTFPHQAAGRVAAEYRRRGWIALIVRDARAMSGRHDSFRTRPGLIPAAHLAWSGRVVLWFLVVLALAWGVGRLGRSSFSRSAGFSQSGDQSVWSEANARLELPRPPAVDDPGSILDPNERSDPRELPPLTVATDRLPSPAGDLLRRSVQDAGHACWPATPRLRC